MDGLLIKLFVFFIVYKIYDTRFASRFVWFLIGILFIPDHFVMFEPMQTNSSRFFIVFFALIVFATEKNVIKKIKSFPLLKSLIILLVCFILISIFDDRLNLNIAKILNRSLGFFTDNFLVMLLAFLVIRDFQDLVKAYKLILYIFLLFAFYGLVNYLTKSNPYMTFICQAFSVRDFAKDYMSNFDGRIRITSFAWHPIYYGFLLSIAFLMSFFLHNTLKIKKTKKNLFIFISGLVLLNLFLVNSRTPLFAFFGGFMIFFTFGIDFGKKVRFIVIGLCFGGFLLSFVPKVADFFNDYLDTFSSRGSKLEGSSVEMRNIQLASTLYVFNKSPVTGNGFSYITENLGFKGSADERASDSSFAGFESYLYKLLIEQGIIGITGHAIFLLLLIIYLVVHFFNAKSDIRKKLAILTLAMLVSFLLFIFGTGDLGTFKFFLAIVGCNIKGLESLKLLETTRVS